MTKKKRMERNETIEEKLKTTQLAYEMALQINHFKGSFLARAAHELRSPLSSLISLHNLILSDLCENPQEEREFIAQASESAQKLLGLLDQLVSVSKLESCPHQLNLAKLALREIFHEVYSLTHLQAANYNLKLNFILPESEIYVLGDFYWLRQVLLMLMEGAISSLETGTIEVFCQLEPLFGAVINIKIPTPVNLQSEPLNLLHPDGTKTARGGFSLYTTFSLCQQVLKLMEGGCDYLLLPEVTHLKCSIPLASLDSSSHGITP